MGLGIIRSEYPAMLSEIQRTVLSELNTQLVHLKPGAPRQNEGNREGIVRTAHLVQNSFDLELNLCLFS